MLPPEPVSGLNFDGTTKRSWKFVWFNDLRIGDIAQGCGRVLDVAYLTDCTQITFSVSGPPVELALGDKSIIYAFTEVDGEEDNG